VYIAGLHPKTPGHSSAPRYTWHSIHSGTCTWLLLKRQTKTLNLQIYNWNTWS